ncbi:hypothetical protein SUGI_0393770 [Cryptomeria japonica]|uniref:U-box domain-containing protein 21 n=1 Tax=Cryptomeria japonica TaxID=3369 RepID=UPI002408CB94|nr:U-box domain-containing protein 21 [Cryptomeria japonica]GLJ21388.1 hypothetical protein SUGI_0393770 [Cryptomeria japonica]
MASEDLFQAYIERTLPKSAEGLEEEDLVEMVKKCETKAALTTIYYLSRDITVRVKLIKGGAIPLVLESLAEADKRIYERGLAAMDLLCSCSEGRAAAYEHALTVPLVVKKILRVSTLATDFAISILWTLCRHSSNGSAMLDALQSGAFQKILVVIQLGCSEKTRMRATQLLKLFSHYRDEWECIETVDFKDVKRSF